MHPKPLTLGVMGGRGGSRPCHQPDACAHTAAAKTRVLVQLQRAQTRCPGPGPGPGPGTGGGHQGPQAGLARGEAWRPRPTAPADSGPGLSFTLLRLSADELPRAGLHLLPACAVDLTPLVRRGRPQAQHRQDTHARGHRQTTTATPPRARAH